MIDTNDESRILEFTVPPTAGRMRLDAALGLFMPGLGLRARRRLWKFNRISVNGKPEKPGFMTKPGDVIRLIPPGEARLPDAAKEGEKTAIRILAANQDFIALYKPAGMHSARIAASPGSSLEEELRRRWPEIYGHWQGEGQPPPAEGAAIPVLLTRLDWGTSGIVLAAKNGPAAQRFRLQEKEGLVSKNYLALVRGKLESGLSLRQKLDTRNRARTRLRAEDHADAARHSLVSPVRLLTEEEKAAFAPQWRESEASLVRVAIRRGARHQIRAHLAAAGFPLLGDELYGGAEGTEERPRFFLHHAKLAMPGFSVECPPDWPLVPDMDIRPE